MPGRVHGSQPRKLAWQVGVLELEEAFGTLHVAQPVHPEIPQARPRREVLARQFAHGRGHQDLAAVRERADRGAADHGDPAPAGALGLHLSGVQRDANHDPQPAWPALALDRSLDLERARQSVRGAREHREGRAFFASLLVRRPAAHRHGRGDQLVVSSQRAGRLAGIPGEQPRDVLDGGQHDRHGRAAGARPRAPRTEARTAGSGSGRYEHVAPVWTARSRCPPSSGSAVAIWRTALCTPRPTFWRARSAWDAMGRSRPPRPTRAGQLAGDEVELLLGARRALVVGPVTGLLELLAQLDRRAPDRPPWPARPAPRPHRPRRRPSARLRASACAAPPRAGAPVAAATSSSTCISAPGCSSSTAR